MLKLSTKLKVFVRPLARNLAENPLIGTCLPVPPRPPVVVATDAPRRQDDRRPAAFPPPSLLSDVTMLPPPAQPAHGGKRDA